MKVPKWPVLLFAAYEMSHLFFFHFPCLSFGFLFPFLELYRQTSIRECVRHSPLLFCCLYWRGILINLRWNILRINAAQYGRHIDNYWPIQRTRDVLYCLSSVKVDANFDSLVNWPGRPEWPDDPFDAELIVDRLSIRVQPPTRTWKTAAKPGLIGSWLASICSWWIIVLDHLRLFLEQPIEVNHLNKPTIDNKNKTAGYGTRWPCEHVSTKSILKL